MANEISEGAVIALSLAGTKRAPPPFRQQKITKLTGWHSHHIVLAGRWRQRWVEVTSTRYPIRSAKKSS